ncbi:MAG: sugar ABC transporter permease [Candidatus Marinimicrobia bacterium]|jgi:multiple sugar transport system permease protein|nr:sugar ABC transporter permease [Candidatus Neomarinimicrobiota bacterium]MBT3825959.1 sugar ABC transporter permease [Candidatus Neomarinimicrobiota bacterium]MBT4131370.1 sugar ABC transporter permease [Candidatus Neomarinimicrobiota bacterium]MBT4296293.1 sugar ABC transporter permease [Candidatus Neomarinimicrobiota bacterium]MBT4421402.1 sugar ABC transporter permease [Candidatus Neomarinimicrobiota bacterium]
MANSVTLTRTPRNRNLDQLQLLLPIMVPVLLLSFIPLIRGIYIGFTDYELGGQINFSGLDNYRIMMQDRFFWRSMGVGFLWTAIVTALQIGLGMILALLLNQGLRWTSLYSVLMLVPWAMPPIVRGLMWRQIYSPDTGALNLILTQMGIIDNPINWLASFEWALPAIIVAGVWGEVPKAALFFLAGLKTIPGSLYEAAELDGASAFRKFRHITLPMMKPIMAAVVSLSFMWNFNAFGLIWILTQGGPGGLTRLPMLAAYEEAFRYGYVGYAAAIGNVMVIIISVFLFFYLKVQLKERTG